MDAIDLEKALPAPPLRDSVARRVEQPDVIDPIRVLGKRQDLAAILLADQSDSEVDPREAD